jgi:hypothetical protein
MHHIFRQFMKFAELVNNLELDNMLEVRDKDILAKKSNNLLKRNARKKDIEQERARYKYLIMKKNYSYYKELAAALMGSLNNINEKDKDSLKNFMLDYYGKIEKFKNGKLSPVVVKFFLHRQALEMNKFYLLDSYYFAADIYKNTV